MSVNKRFGQTPPDRANELFEKLLATPDSAIKTRERLFSVLKEELELLASLQEQHLFPVLRKHRMLDLVDQAVNDNRETNALLTEIEQMPKDRGEFLGKVAELRKVFQQHIRDDRKELLPAVLKVLSEEEAEAVVEQVEDEMASISEMKRAEARRIREQGESGQQFAEGVAETTRAGVEGAQTVVRTMQEVVENSVSTFSDLARSSTGQALQIFGRTGGEPQGAAEQASQNFRVVAQSSVTIARAVQDATQEYLELSQRRWQTNLDGLNELARCRSWADFVTVQSSLIRSNLEQTLDNSRRIAELTVQAAQDATRSVTVEAEKPAQRNNRSTRAA